MEELDGQQLVNLCGVVVPSTDMIAHHGFNLCSLEIRPGERHRIEQHAAQVLGQGVAIPDAKMRELVTAQETTLELQRRQEAIDRYEPLRHAPIVQVLGLELRLAQRARNRA